MPRPKFEMLKHDPARQAINWHAMADAEIPADYKQAFELMVDLNNKPYRHKFQCVAQNPVAAINKYLWHVKSMGLQIGRIDTVTRVLVDTEHHERSFLTEVYPAGAFPEQTQKVKAPRGRPKKTS